MKKKTLLILVAMILIVDGLYIWSNRRETPEEIIEDVSIKIEEDKPFYEIKPAEEDHTIEELLKKMNDNKIDTEGFSIPDGMFPGNPIKANEDFKSDHIILNIDTKDAKEFKQFFDDRLYANIENNKQLLENVGQYQWSFVKVIDVLEEDDILSFSWINAFVTPMGSFSSYSLHHASFDLTDGSLLNIKDLVNREYKDLIQNYMINDAKEFVKNTEYVDNNYPKDIKYIDSIATDEIFDINKETDTNKTFVYIPEKYAVAKFNDKVKVVYETVYKFNTNDGDQYHVSDNHGFIIDNLGEIQKD